MRSLVTGLCAFIVSCAHAMPPRTPAEQHVVEEAGNVARAHYHAIQHCWRTFAIANPQPRNQDLAVAFTVTVEGRVSNLRIIDDSLDEPSLRQCVLDEVVRWSVPNTSGGVVHDVAIHFTLNPFPHGVDPEE